MPEISSITDAELVEQIKTSNLDERQKIELKPLIPDMTAEERARLLNLIEQSNKIEKLGEKPETGDIETTSDVSLEDKSAEALTEKPKETARTELGKVKKHTLRNTMLIIFLLILITAVVLVGLSYL